MFKLYLLLSATVLILTLFWLRSRHRLLALGTVVFSGLLVLLVIYDLIRPESVAEQMQRKLEAMATAVKARDLDGLFQHVSSQFDSGRYNKSALRAMAEQVLNSGELSELSVWNFGNVQVRETTATIDFKVTVIGSHGEAYLRCTATFILDSDGEWRLKSYQLFDGVSNREIHI